MSTSPTPTAVEWIVRDGGETVRISTGHGNRYVVGDSRILRDQVALDFESAVRVARDMLVDLQEHTELLREAEEIKDRYVSRTEAS